MGGVQLPRGQLNPPLLLSLNFHHNHRKSKLSLSFSISFLPSFLSLSSYVRQSQIRHCCLANPSQQSSTMDASDLSKEVAKDFSPYLKIYKDGHVERIAGVDTVPPSLDPKTGVDSKDVVISPENDVPARVYIPKAAVAGGQKLPLLVYFHGGAFCIETPFSSNYHNFLNALVAEASVVAVSVHYRRAPEHPLPVAYEDSWESIKWVASHFDGKGPEQWLNSGVDYERVFFGGDSAGANIAHHMGLRVSAEGLGGPKLFGLALIHPFFWGTEPVGSEDAHGERGVMADAIWRFACPTTTGSDDPLINPGKDPNLGKLSAQRVLVCVAEKDVLKDRGWYYKQLLEKSGWSGTVVVDEAEDEDHVFHMLKPTCDNALALIKKVASFIKQA